MSTLSLGSYAVRNYNVFAERNPQVHDLINYNISSFNQSHGSEWRPKEIVKLQALLTLCSVYGALELYWKGFCVLLSSATPCLSPSTLHVSSLFFISNRRANDSDLPLVSRKVILSVLALVIQLTDGGSELSEFSSLFRKKDKKPKKQDDDAHNVLNVSPEVIENSVKKLDCLCEVPFLDIFLILVVVVAINNHASRRGKKKMCHRKGNQCCKSRNS